METLIGIILLIMAVITGSVFLLQLLNMVVVIKKQKGKASLSLLMPAICAVCLYLMNKL